MRDWLTQLTQSTKFIRIVILVRPKKSRPIQGGFETDVSRVKRFKKSGNFKRKNRGGLRGERL